MQKVLSILVENTSGVLSHVSGLFSRRGYNIDSFSAGVTADPRFTRMTIVTSGDELILDQIEKQLSKLEDVVDIKVLSPSDSVTRELMLVKIEAKDTDRQSVLSITEIFHGKVVDVTKDSMVIEVTGHQDKLVSFLDTDTRDQIIVWMVEKMQDTIVSSVNKALHDYLGGDAIMIGTIYVEDSPGPKITLHAVQVKTDSSQLTDSPALTGIIGGVAKLAFLFSDPAAIEKDVIKLLSSDYVKPKIISTLSDGLRKAGLHLTLSDIVVREDTGKDKIPHMTDPEKDEGLLPDAIEDKIIDALAGWLKQTLTV